MLTSLSHASTKILTLSPYGSDIDTITVDGYQAIVDGTSVYIGVANCGPPGPADGNCSSGVYTNILLFSYNRSASSDTVNIFNQLVNTLKINQNLVTSDDLRTVETCSQDTSVNCAERHDAECKEKNAGLCQSAKAEIRRDYKRMVDLHDILSTLDRYERFNKFCNDGTNNLACNTDADCPTTLQCVGVYPALSSGTYIAGRPDRCIWCEFLLTGAGQLLRLSGF
jgi:hypothetical protein